MNLTEKQQQIVLMIDHWVTGILSQGGGDEEILAGMYDYMTGFKHLMDALNQEDINWLCNRYEGFYRFAKLLENLAGAIASGDIEAPGTH